MPLSIVWACCSRLASKLAKSDNMIFKKNLNKNIPKNSDFHAALKFVENFRKTIKNSIWRIWVKEERCIFPFYFWFGAVFTTFSKDLKSAWNSVFLNTTLLNFVKNFVLLILLFYKNFEDKHTWNDSKKYVL
jgi:hypothetical protein